MKCSSCITHHWYPPLSASLLQSSALGGLRCPFHGVLTWGHCPSPGQLFLPHPAQCWEPSEIRRAQSRGKQPLESCYQMAEIYKASRYVYTATCLAPGTGVLCHMWVVTEPQLQGQGSCPCSLHQQPLVTAMKFYPGLLMIPWPLLDRGKSRFSVRGCLYCLVCDVFGGLTWLSVAEAAFLCLGAQGCFQTLPGWAESLPCSKLGLPRYLAPILESSVKDLS